MDVHIPRPITAQLRLLGVDVLTTQEDGHAEVEDRTLMDRATELGRVLFSQDKGCWWRRLVVSGWTYRLAA
ncbi:MAG TPA: DUF5615 family PIN-like protein [Anaerolineae bacterium]